MSMLFRVRSRLKLTVGVGVVAGLAGCAFSPATDRVLGVFKPYQLEVVQGNVVTQEQASRISTGMSRSQVRDILGSPLLTDIFHADRWDYVFTIRRQGAEPQRRSIVVMFDGEKLKSIDTGGELPAEDAFVASIDSVKAGGKPPALELTSAQLQALKPPPKPAAVEPSVITPGRTYPPLESR